MDSIQTILEQGGVTLFGSIVALIVASAAVTYSLRDLQRGFSEFRKLRTFKVGVGPLSVELERFARDAELVTSDGVLTKDEVNKLRREATNAAEKAKLLEDENSNLKIELEASLDLYLPIERIRDRLVSEGRRLGRDAWINLLIGIAFAVFGIGVLLQDFLAGTAVTVITSHDITRISLGLFINIVAFFFFRMYLSNQNDIRHNKNEITTIEMRFAALRVAILRNDAAAISALLTNLSSSERNRILKRGERALSESIAHDKNEIVDTISQLISRDKKPAPEQGQ